MAQRGQFAASRATGSPSGPRGVRVEAGRQCPVADRRSGRAAGPTGLPCGQQEHHPRRGDETDREVVDLPNDCPTFDIPGGTELEWPGRSMGGRWGNGRWA